MTLWQISASCCNLADMSNNRLTAGAATVWVVLECRSCKSCKGATGTAFLWRVQVVLELKCYSEGLCHAGECATIIALSASDGRSCTRIHPPKLEPDNQLLEFFHGDAPMFQRLSVVWRLALLFVRESRPRAGSPPIHNVLRSVAAGARVANSPSLGQRVPIMHNLSGVLTFASGVLSQHPALSETAVRVALAELQTLKAPLEGPSCRAALEKALPPGRSESLTDFDPTPQRCGIAEQTHRGSLALPGARPVPVRITLVRADTRAELDQDLDVLAAAARFAERFSREVRKQNVAVLVARVSELIDGMFDLRQRAADQSYLRYRLRDVNDDQRIVVPEVFWDFSNDRVLVTRSIRSVPLSDAAALRASGLDPAALIATWIEAFFEIALGEGVFHAGLEAASAAVSIEPQTRGRLVLDGDSPLTFFAAHEQNFLVTGSDALLRGDHKSAARAHLEHGRPALAQAASRGCRWSRRIGAKPNDLLTGTIRQRGYPSCSRRLGKGRSRTRSRRLTPAWLPARRCSRARCKPPRRWRGGLPPMSTSGASRGA